MIRTRLLFGASAVLALISLQCIGCERKPSPATTTATTAATLPATSTPSGVTSAAVESPLPSASASAGAATSGAVTFSFDKDALGAAPAGVEAVIGDWGVSEHDGARGLFVDGSRWRNGTPSATLADQARRLYGDRYAEFLDGVKAFAFFPLAVVERPPPETDLRLSVRFLPVAGKIDQAAGIAFGIAPDGSYYGVRANALEDNVLYFHVVRGKRSIIDTVRNTPTPSNAWHTLVVGLRGTELHVNLDGQMRLHKKLDATPRGRVGLWSKADSQVLFDDFKIEPLG